jgi:hypothetical protein
VSVLGLWHRIGEVYERKILDPVAGQTWYRKVLERHDRHVAAQRGRARTCNALGRWDELIELVFEATVLAAVFG